jgi:hypothetical protein
VRRPGFGAASASEIWDYWTSAATSAAGGTVRPAGALSQVKSGYYADGAYVYQYTSTSGRILIVVSPTGARNVVVAPGTRAYSAIMLKLPSLPALSNDALRALTARVHAETAPKRRTSTLPTPAVIADDPAPASSSVPSWAFGAGAVALALGAAAVLWPRRAS